MTGVFGREEKEVCSTPLIVLMLKIALAQSNNVENIHQEWWSKTTQYIRATAPILQDDIVAYN